MSRDSFTLSARKLPSGKYEGRVTVNGRHVSSGTFAEHHQLVNWLDYNYDEILLRPNGKK